MKELAEAVVVMVIRPQEEQHRAVVEQAQVLAQVLEQQVQLTLAEAVVVLVMVMEPLGVQV